MTTKEQLIDVLKLATGEVVFEALAEAPTGNLGHMLDMINFILEGRKEEEKSCNQDYMR